MYVEKMRKVYGMLCLSILYSSVHPFAQAQNAQEQSLSLDRKEGIDYASQGRFVDAEEWFRKHLEKYKIDQTSSGALAAIQDLNQGKLTKEAAISLFRSLKFLEEGKVEAGVSQLFKTIEISPRYARTYNLLGVVYTSQGQADKGLYYFENAIGINREYSEAYYNLAALQQSLGRPEEALRNYKKVIKLKPDSLDALTHAGELCASLGRYEEAIRYYRNALRIDSSQPDIYYNLALAYFMSDNLMNFKDNLTKAQELYKQRNDDEGLQKVDQYMRKIESLKNKLKKKG